MKVLIADDHPLVREALARLVQAVVPTAEVCEADDRPTAEALLAHDAQALVLLDLHMPGMRGVLGVAELHARWPGLPLVVVSGDDDAATVRAVLAAGARGFLPKGEAAAVLQQALRLVIDGGRYVPTQALSDLGAGAPPPRPVPGALTPRQQDVLRCLMRGQPNKQIARDLGIGEGTVKLHLAAVLRALHARNRTEAVVRARELGWGA